MKTLKISKDISLPLDFVTQAAAILAKRRAGKSYTMRRIAEQLLGAEQQVVLVDPKGDQWGIRSSADGKKPGYPITILGGEHGDVPLEVGAGELVAKLVVEERVSILLDLSMFRKHEIATFMTAFMENLYRLKAKEDFRTPVMLIIDEADAIAPQKPQKGEERMLGAAEDIVRRGGQRGIGCLLITQRSAVLNKNVLTQAQMLIVLRTIAPQDLAAMKAWVDVHGTIEQGKELMESLPSLPVGDAWFWSPGWPTNEGIFTRAHVLPIETFDSGATPKPGEKKIVPKNLADVDLEALKNQMAATIEKAKNDDPKNLRKRIGDLEKENTSLKARSTPLVEPTTQVKEVRVEVPVLKDSQIKRIEEAANKMYKEAERHGKAMAFLWGNFDQVGKSLAEAMNAITTVNKITAPLQTVTPHPPRQKEQPVASERKPVSIGVELDGSINPREQKILDAVAWLESINVAPSTVAVAFLSDYVVSGNFNNLKGGLKTKGLIEYPTPGVIKLTDEGRSLANLPESTPTQGELHEKVKNVLGDRHWKILKPLIDAYPEALSTQEIAAAAGYEVSGNFNNLKGRLRTLGLIDYPRPNYSQASDILFL